MYFYVMFKCTFSIIFYVFFNGRQVHIDLDCAWLSRCFGWFALHRYIAIASSIFFFSTFLFRVATGQLITEKRDGSENVAYGGVRVGDWFRSTSGYAPLKHDIYTMRFIGSTKFTPCN